MANASRQPRLERLLSCEEFEARLCLSAVSFASHDIGITANGPRSVYAADVDGDGDMDVLSRSLSDDKIAWYENIDGKGMFGQQKGITTDARGAISVYAPDLDGDGDLDVLSASCQDDKIAWYENTDGKGNFGPQRVISIEADFAVSVFVADVDGKRRSSTQKC